MKRGGTSYHARPCASTASLVWGFSEGESGEVFHDAVGRGRKNRELTGRCESKGWHMSVQTGVYMSTGRGS
jgi:hypothetical protein